MKSLKTTITGNFFPGVLIALIIFVISSFVYAKEEGNRIRFKHLSIEDGLSEVAVWCITQDSRGFMWFGTQDGLNRYDGYQFKIYKNIQGDKKSLSDNFILCLHKDQDGFLWIGTKAGGVNKFDPNTEEFTRYPFESLGGKKFNTDDVKVIFKDTSKVLWVGTEGGGLKQLAQKTGNIISYTNVPKNFGNIINTIYEDTARILWVGTETGLYQLDRNKGEFQQYKSNETNSASFSCANVTAIGEDHHKNLWIGTNGTGLFKLDQKTGRSVSYAKDQTKPYDLPSNNIKCLYSDHNNILWVGTELGVSILEPGSGHFIHYKHKPNDRLSLGDGESLSIFENQEGIIWIGAYGDGVNIYDPSFNQFQLYRSESGNPKSLSGNSTWAILEDREKILWIGIYQKGLNRVNRKTGEYRIYLPEKDVRCIIEDYEKKILWIGTKGHGLIAFDSQKCEPIPEKEAGTSGLNDTEVTSLFQARSGDLWIGTRQGGLNKFNPKTKMFSSFTHDGQESKSLSHNFVRAILEDTKGRLWIGTEGGGLNQLANGIFIHYLHEEKRDDSLSHNRIKAIHEDKNHTLWIGTEGGGINKLVDSEHGIFKSYREKDGLSSDTVYGILEDKQNNLWLSTNRGLSRFNPTIEKFKNYNDKDGLQGNEFNTGAFFKNKNTGEMFFGGDKGFNAFFSWNIKKDKFEPPIVITEFHVLNKPIFYNSNATGSSPNTKTLPKPLSYKEDMISFEFAALQYSNTSKNKYQYQLEGFDEKPINGEAKNRRATYTNLPAGKYTFRVWGCNKDGQWSPRRTSIELRILPAPWFTWWAFCLYFMVLVTIVFWYVRYQQKKIAYEHEANERLEKRVKLRTQELDKKKEALEQINQIVQSINAEMNFNELLYKILSVTKMIKGSDVASALVWDTEIKKFVFQAVCDCEPKEFEALKKLQFTEEDAEKRYVHGSEKIDDDIFMAKHVSQRFLSDKIESFCIPKAMLITRIRIEGKTLAYFIFDNMQNENAFDDQDRLLMQNLKEHFVAAFKKTILISQLEKRNSELEKIQDQLIQAEKLSSLGTMLAGVAHELNNPAAAILLNSEYFYKEWAHIEGLLDEQYKINNEIYIGGLPYAEAKEEISKLIIGLIKSAEHIQNVVKELKEYSGKTSSLDRNPVDINKVIQSAIILTRNKIKKSTHKFIFQPGDGLPEILGSTSRLAQVMVNLIQNACDALADDSKGIYIKTSYNRKDGEIIVQVTDEGEGIEEKNLKSITDPFFTTKRSIGGTGLGLSISAKIIQDHQGQMIFNSTPGKGTTVIIQLPVTRTKEKVHSNY